MQFRLREIFGNPDKTSVHYGKKSMVVPASIQEMSDGWFLWISGKFVQDAFPKLNADQREFLMTGLLPEEFQAATAEDEQ